jgi:hypothetical protein
MNWNAFALGATGVILGAGLYVLTHYWPDPTLTSTAQMLIAGGAAWFTSTQVHGK